MRILIAPDKFKGSLGAAQVATQIAAGLRDVLPDADITLLPIADGGEGTASVICGASGGEWHACKAHDPLGHMVEARYGTIEKGEIAVMEMSEASGLWRLKSDERDPLRATSFGTGEMLLDATKRGVREIIIGLGGSATNDGGFGMARALGFRFLDAGGRELGKSVADLLQLERIVASGWLRLPSINAAVDVRNPLLGDRGATRAFGSQKGVAADQIDVLEPALSKLADVVARDLGIDGREAPGAGAAGGMGFGLLAFCSAQLRSGFDVVSARICLEKSVCESDVIITGEGRLDAQTWEGKAPAGVAKLAQARGKRVYAIAGSIAGDLPGQRLFDEVVTLADADVSVDEAMERVGELLRSKARELAVKLRVAHIL